MGGQEVVGQLGVIAKVVFCAESKSSHFRISKYLRLNRGKMAFFNIFEVMCEA